MWRNTSQHSFSSRCHHACVLTTPESLDLASCASPSISGLLRRGDGRGSVQLHEPDWWVRCHVVTAAGTLSSRCALDWGHVPGCAMLKWPNVPWQLSSHLTSGQVSLHASLHALPRQISAFNWPLGNSALYSKSYMWLIPACESPGISSVNLNSTGCLLYII